MQRICICCGSIDLILERLEQNERTFSTRGIAISASEDRHCRRHGKLFCFDLFALLTFGFKFGVGDLVDYFVETLLCVSCSIFVLFHSASND